MSNATSDNAGAGRKRRRSRGGRNRNRNRNRQGQQGQSPRHESSSSSRDGNNSNRGRRRSGGRRPEPVKLTWWQKLLKAIGLYKEPQRPARGSSPKTAPKSNTRVAQSPKPRRERESDDGRESGEGRESRKPEAVEPQSNRLYLGNLSYEATESDLEELFKGVGTVRAVEIVYNRRTHRSKGYGFVDMLGVDEAKRAVEVLHDQFFMGRRLVVSGAKSQGPADDDSDDGDNNEDRDESSDS